jgi:hypothetical protein
MNRVSEILATTSAASGRSGSGVNYGTFGRITPSPQTPSRPIPEKDYDEKSEEDEPSSEEDEGAVRMYNVSGPAATERTACVSMNRPPSEGMTTAGGPLMQLATLRVTGPPWRDGPESDENGNGGIASGSTAGGEERRSAQSFSGDELVVNPSLLVTTTVSYDENHKRNSIHLFVSDVNENEHINEVEETTHI